MELRPYTDADGWLTEALETDPEVTRHLGGSLPAHRAREVHHRRLAGAGRFWTVVPAGCDRPVGVVGVWPTPWPGGDIDEVGWMLLPAAHGRGYGTAAVRRLLERLRGDPDHGREVSAFPAVANRASNAICRRLGFTRRGEVDLDYEGRPLRCAHWTISLAER